MSKPGRAYLLCPFGNDSGLYRRWPEQLSIPSTTVDNYRSDWDCPDDAAILISHMHYRWEEANILRRTIEQNKIPVLVLADGILEFRNTFDNPTVSDGSVYQPVFGHKIGCIGRAQMRVLESWGNVGKCELVGMPRFDKYLQGPPEIRSKELKSKQFRIIVTTASTPYFTEDQKSQTVQALTDLKLWFEQNPEFSGRQVQPVWRLTMDLDEVIGVKNNVFEDLFEMLDSVDALITTPSTLAIEGALKDRPVAILDYHNQPSFVPPTWNISHPSQIAGIMTELIEPPEAKMLFQRMNLHDQLECHSPSSPRMVELIESIISHQKPDRGTPMKFPVRFLTDPNYGLQKVEDSFQLEKLFPKNGSFATEDVRRLQTELSRAILRLEQLPDELLENREYNRYLAKRLLLVRDKLKRRNARVWDLRQELKLLTSKVALLEGESQLPVSVDEDSANRSDVES